MCTPAYNFKRRNFPYCGIFESDIKDELRVSWNLDRHLYEQWRFAQSQGVQEIHVRYENYIHNDFVVKMNRIRWFKLFLTPYGNDTDKTSAIRCSRIRFFENHAYSEIFSTEAFKLTGKRK